jgi:hypothetical protein
MLTRARAAPGHAQRCGAARSMRAPAIARVAAAATLRLCLACLRCRAARRRGAQRVALVPRGAFASPASRSPLSAAPQNALRLHDNAALLAALTAAASSGGKVACVFVWSEAEEGSAGPECPRPGAASRVWLHAALASLDADLRRRFATPLLFAAAPHAAALRQLGASLRAGWWMNSTKSVAQPGLAVRRMLTTMMCCSALISMPLKSQPRTTGMRFVCCTPRLPRKTFTAKSRLR